MFFFVIFVMFVYRAFWPRPDCLTYVALIKRVVPCFVFKPDWIYDIYCEVFLVLYVRNSVLADGVYSGTSGIMNYITVTAGPGHRLSGQFKYLAINRRLSRQSDLSDNYKMFTETSWSSTVDSSLQLNCSLCHFCVLMNIFCRRLRLSSCLSADDATWNVNSAVL